MVLGNHCKFQWFWSNHCKFSMGFEETITIECFLAVWPLPPMVFQWFFISLPSLSMVPDHWSNDAMVLMDRCGLPYAVQSWLINVQNHLPQYKIGSVKNHFIFRCWLFWDHIKPFWNSIRTFWNILWIIAWRDRHITVCVEITGSSNSGQVVIRVEITAQQQLKKGPR